MTEGESKRRITDPDLQNTVAAQYDAPNSVMGAYIAVIGAQDATGHERALTKLDTALGANRRGESLPGIQRLNAVETKARTTASMSSSAPIEPMTPSGLPGEANRPYYREYTPYMGQPKRRR